AILRWWCARRNSTAARWSPATGSCARTAFGAWRTTRPASWSPDAQPPRAVRHPAGLTEAPVARRGDGAWAALAGAGLLGWMGPASATGVAGDRLFPATLLIEDTQNDDEIALPTVSYLRRGANGDTPAGRDLAISTEFARLLTPDLSFLIDTGWHRISTG